jgi:hypothetical protein
MELDDMFAFSIVFNGYTWIKSHFSTSSAFSKIFARPLGSTRESFGKYYFESIDDRQIGINKITFSDPNYIYENVYESTKEFSPQLGHDFYIYWRYHDLILSRQINGRYWDLFDFEHVRDGSTTSSKFDEPVSYNIEMEGIIHHQPVFYGEDMYIIRDLLDQMVWGKYKYRGWGIITLEEEFVINGLESSIFPDLPETATTCEYAQIDAFLRVQDGLFYRFYYINTNDPSDEGYKSVYMDLSASTPTYQQINFDGAADDLEWFFQQRRVHPDDDVDVVPDVYAYNTDSNQDLYTITFDLGNSEIVEGTPTTLPFLQHWEVDLNVGTCEPDCPGRFDLSIPWDVGEKWLINFSIHKCNGRSQYQFDYYEDISLSYYNFEDGTTGCYTLDAINCDTMYDGYCDTSDAYVTEFNATPGGAPYTLDTLSSGTSVDVSKFD